MSVVNSCLPCYRGEAAHHFAPHSKYTDLRKHLDVFDYSLSPDPTLFPGTFIGNRKQLILEGKDVSADWRFSNTTSKYLMRLLAGASKWEIDTNACYKFVKYLELGTVTLAEAKTEIDINVGLTAMSLVKDCGLINPGDALDKMSEQRVTRALEKRFIEDGASVYIRELLSMCSGEEIGEFGIQVATSNATCLGVNLDDLYECSPLSMYDSILAKFKKSATLINALGPKVTRAIIKAYQDDGKRCYISWCNT